MKRLLPLISALLLLLCACTQKTSQQTEETLLHTFNESALPVRIAAVNDGYYFLLGQIEGHTQTVSKLAFGRTPDALDDFYSVPSGKAVTSFAVEGSISVWCESEDGMSTYFLHDLESGTLHEIGTAGKPWRAMIDVYAGCAYCFVKAEDDPHTSLVRYDPKDDSRKVIWRSAGDYCYGFARDGALACILSDRAEILSFADGTASVYRECSLSPSLVQTLAFSVNDSGERSAVIAHLDPQNGVRTLSYLAPGQTNACKITDFPSDLILLEDSLSLKNGKIVRVTFDGRENSAGSPYLLRITDHKSGEGITIANAFSFCIKEKRLIYLKMLSSGGKTSVQLLEMPFISENYHVN